MFGTRGRPSGGEAPPVDVIAPSVHREVWRLAWPSVMTFVLMTTNSILDRMFVGRLGAEALAAVGVGSQITFVLGSLTFAISTGTTALVSRFTGAQDKPGVEKATGQSVAISFLVGLLCMAGAFAALGPYLNTLHITPRADSQCREFMHWALLGLPASALAMALSAAFRGAGDTRSPLKVMVFANIVHILGDWTLMLGHWGFPRMGVAGGGIAMTSSNVVSLAVFAAQLWRSPLKGALKRACLVPEVAWALRIMRIGVPAAVAAFLRSSSMLLFTGILARTTDGTRAVAALPIGLTAESIAFMPGFGFSVASSALVGQYLGARNPDRAEKCGWSAAWQACLVMSAMGLLFYVAAEWFARIFTHDPAVLPLAVSYLRIMAISEPFLAFSMVLTGALQGAGDTVRPTVLTGITFWGFRVPAAWFLALHLHMQASGAWIAMAATVMLGGVLTALLFRDGKWKKVRV